MDNTKMIQWFDEHWYAVKINDNETRYLPSVTSKQGIESKPFLSRWRGDLGNRECDYRMFESQMRGTRIHHAWEGLQLGKEVVFEPSKYFSVTEDRVTLCYQDEMVAVDKLYQAYNILKPEILSVENIVYSLSGNYAGTVDSVWKLAPGEYAVSGSKPVKLKGGVYVVDLKTGKGIYETAHEQVAAYAEAMKEMGLYKDIVGTIILHTSASTKKGIEGFSAIVSEDYANAFDNFKAVSELYDRRNANKAPKVAKFPANYK